MKTTAENQKTSCVDYSSVTPATGTNSENHPIADSFANGMPASDVPALEGSPRARPDKTIPGAEAATGVDLAEEDHTQKTFA